MASKTFYLDHVLVSWLNGRIKEHISELKDPDNDDCFISGQKVGLEWVLALLEG